MRRCYLKAGICARYRACIGCCTGRSRSLNTAGRPVTPPRTVPELAAYQLGEVFTWDITKLAGPMKGAYFDAYVMIDIYSRYIVGCQVHTRESGQLAREFIAQVFATDQVPRSCMQIAERR